MFKATGNVSRSDLVRADRGRHPPTLLSAGLETLYSGFRRAQERDGRLGDEGSGSGSLRELGGAAGGGGDDDDDSGGQGKRIHEGMNQEEARRVRREEEKVRALNGNGRVDYAIQE